MNRRTMRKLEDWILTLLSFIHAVLLFSTPYIFYASMSERLDHGMWGNLLQASVLFLPVIVSFYMHRKIRNVFLYLILAIGICIGEFYLTRNYLTLICSALIFLIRFRTRIDRGRILKQIRDYPGGYGRIYAPEAWEIPTILDRPKPVLWVIFVAMYMVLIYTGAHQYLNCLFALLFLEIAVTFFHNYIEHMEEYIADHQKIASLPGKMILRNGYVILCGLALALVLFMVPSILYGKEPLTGLYHEREPVNILELEAALEDQEEVQDPMMEYLERLIGEAKEPPAWLKALIVLSEWIVTALVYIFIIRMAYVLLRKVMGAFAEEEEDEVINLKDMKEEQKKLQREQKKRERELRRTTNARIRRKYKKRILKYISKKPAGTETPEELETAAKFQEKPDHERIHALYEKARYSQTMCTEEEEKSFLG